MKLRRKPPVLTIQQVRSADAWYEARRKPFKTVAAQLGVHPSTLRDAVKRRNGYESFPRE